MNFGAKKQGVIFGQKPRQHRPALDALIGAAKIGFIESRFVAVVAVWETAEEPPFPLGEAIGVSTSREGVAVVEFDSRAGFVVQRDLRDHAQAAVGIHSVGFQQSGFGGFQAVGNRRTYELRLARPLDVLLD